jgi:predicted GTPase
LSEVSSLSGDELIRFLAVIDGEHYPPVVESALEDVIATGHVIVGAVLAGGGEKLPEAGFPDLAGDPNSSPLP